LVDEVSENPLVAVEMDNDRTARLRFSRSATREKLVADYLVGNGAAGNVAAEAITMITSGPATTITSVRNPLPATGGTDPETMDQARRAIPGYQLTNQPRALTVEDYVAIAETVPGVRNATALDRWTGDRLRIRVAVQPLAGAQPEAALLHRVEQVLVVCRRIGHDVRVTAPDYRAVAITVNVDLDAFAIRDESRRQIAQVLSGGRLDDGKPAFFHPSRFGFGDPLYQSALVAAVQDLPGVQTVEVTRMSFLRPQHTPARDEKTKKPPTVLNVAPTAIIRCDNDPVSPQNGYVGINLVGGR
jgi:predicted phage baseplate assembly protein